LRSDVSCYAKPYLEAFREFLIHGSRMSVRKKRFPRAALKLCKGPT
jgi:hypothetical protein